MVTKKFSGFIYLLMLVLLLESGCNTFNTAIPSQMTNANIQKSTPTRIDSKDNIIITLPIPTSPPAKITVVPEPTKKKVLPSPTLLNTLTSDQEKELLKRFLLDNGDCRLPCLWGITPGITDIDTLDTILNLFNDVSIPSVFNVQRRLQEESGRVTFIMWKENTRVPITLSYYNKQDTNEQVTLAFEAGLEEGEGDNLSINAVYGDPFFEQILGHYRLSNILSEYGVPSEVLIAPFPDDTQYPPETAIPFSFVLFYKTQGMLLEYISPMQKNGQYFVGCPTRSGYLSVVVWDPQQNVSIEEITTKTSGIGVNSLNVNYFQPLENVTTLTLEDFYQIFKDSSSTTCIETSVDIWK